MSSESPETLLNTVSRNKLPSFDCAVFEARARLEVTNYANNPAAVMANKIWEWARDGIAGYDVIDLAEEVVSR